MEADVHGPTTAPLLRAAEPVRGRSELERLRSACRRQALVMDTLTRAVLHLRRGASALRADNAELRAENAWLRTHQRDGVRAGAEDYMGELRLPVDVHAPGASRAVIAQCLHDRLDAGALERAQLLVSELVSNSVRHSGASPDEAVRIRFELTQTALRLEVDDPGEAAVVRRREANVANGGGFGLNLVDALSARWGAEPNAGGGTRVWAQLSCAAAAGPSPAA